MTGGKSNGNRSENLAPQAKILGLGITCVIGGIFLFAGAFAEFEFGYSTIPPAGLVLLCGFVLYRAFIAHKRSYVVFLGLFGFMGGLLLFAVESNILPYGFPELWPFLALFSGLSLAASGFYAKGRPSVSYLIPSALLLILGVFFLLFSTDIINITLSAFAAKWLPAGLIVTGAVLVGLFFFRSALARLTAPFLDFPDDSDHPRIADDD